MTYKADKPEGVKATSADVATGSDPNENLAQNEMTSQGRLSSDVGDNDVALTTIKELHWLLASRYVEIIDLVSRPGLLPHKRHLTHLGRQLHSLRSKLEDVRIVHQNASRYRPITRTLVESHNKRKLQELQAIYTQIEQTLPLNGRGNPPLKDWLVGSQDSCSRWASTLTSWASIRGLLAIFWPVALGLIAAWLGADNIWKAVWNVGNRIPAYDRPIFSMYALFTVVYAGALAGITFNSKRHLFLRKAPATAHSDPALPPMMSTYELEDALFNHLRKQKKLEVPIDLLGPLVVIAGTLAFVGVIIYFAGFNVLVGVFSVFILWVFGTIMINILRRYRKEPR